MMSTNRKKRRSSHRGNLSRGGARAGKLLAIKIAAAAAGAALVLTAVLLIRGAHTDKAAEAVGQNGGDSAAVVIQDEQTEREEGETPDKEETLPEVAADVGRMEDAEDPQNGSDAQEGDKTGVDEALKSAGPRETGSVSLGIDVAKYQDIIDWQQVAEAGVEFAMIRAGYRTSSTGVICEDPLARYNMQEASAAGIKLGVYFFSTAVNEAEAKEEAAWLTGFIAKYPITYPVAFNCENFTSESSRQYGLDAGQRTDNAVAFLEYVKSQGYEPMFYAAKNEMEGSAQWDMTKIDGNYKVWVSQYPEKAYPATEKSSYSGPHDMWQFTSRGSVPGIGKSADMNVAYFSYGQAAAPKDGEPAEAVEANPEANIIFEEVNETVTAKIETNLRTAPGTASDETIAARLVNPDTAVRTGIGHNGWSRVTYQGQTYYAVSSYLTTDLSFRGVKQEEAKAAQAAEAGDTAAQGQEGSAADNAGSTPESGPAAEEQAASLQQNTDTVYRTVSEQVTAKDTTNLRSAPDKTDPGNVVGSLKYGEVVTRTAIGKNGWSILSVNGRNVYAVSGYLTTNLNYQDAGKPTPENPDGNAVFTPVSEQVTAKSVTNLRSLPSSESDETIVAALHNGEVVTRTAVGSNGWSKIDYNGQTVYAVSSYLTPAVQ